MKKEENQDLFKTIFITLFKTIFKTSYKKKKKWKNNQCLFAEYGK